MKATKTTLLLTVNGVLLALLAVVTVWPGVFSPVAIAGQPGGQPLTRQRGQYVMISGRAQGSTTNVVYVLDTVNQELVAVRYNRGTQGLEPIGFRSVADDAKAGGGGR